MNHTIPDQILVAGEFFGPDSKDEPMLVGKVVAILRDTDNDQFCIFEMADMAGLFSIHLGSNFWLGWYADGEWHRRR